MDGWSVLTHVATFGVGILTGGFGQYFADKYTDRRRKKEGDSDELNRFRRVREQMPELIADFKSSLLDPEHQHVREFFVVKSTWLVNSDLPRFAFFTDKVDGLMQKVKLLENHGYVVDITPQSAPMYRMTEEFVKLVLTQ